MSAGATWRAPDALLVWIAAAVLAAAIAVVTSGPSDEQRAAERELQAVLGGLGLGRATNLGRCMGAFDPRLGESCELRHSPLPGAEWICPDHAFPRVAGR